MGLKEFIEKSEQIEITISKNLWLVYEPRANRAFWMMPISSKKGAPFLNYIYTGPDPLQVAIDAFEKALKEGYSVP